MYSSEEIEKKRLLALERRNASMQKINQVNNQKRPSTSPINGAPAKQLKPSNYQNSSWSTQKSQFTKNQWTANKNQYQNNKTIKSQSPNNFYSSTPISATCYLINDKRFEVTVSSYFQPFIDYCKKFNTKNYNQQSRLWNFSINEYDYFIKNIRKEIPNITVEGIPEFVRKRFQQSPKQEQEIDMDRIDAKLLTSLMPFQREGVRFGIKFNGKCIIADDMGLGKTIQALGIVDYYRNDWPLLIVCPASVRYSWAEAVYEFLPTVSVQDVLQYESNVRSLGGAKIIITSYDLLARGIDRFTEREFKTIIFDESHILKSHKTERYKAGSAAAVSAQHIILLSGTPALSRPKELYSQLKLIINPFMSFNDYGKRYCAGELTRFGWNFNGSSNTQELQILLKSCGLLRRLKADTLQELPAKIREVIQLDPSLIGKSSEEEQKLARSLSRANNHHTLVQYYSQSSTNRLKAVTSYIVDLLASEEKFLVFAHHSVMLNAVEDLVMKKKVKYIRIDGSTKDVDRQNYVDQFQNDDNCKVAILSITAAGTGITLTAAKFVVFAELYWNPGILAQAEDRAHRIGQNSNVLVKYLVAKGTSDDFMWPIIQSKLDFLNKAGLNQDFKLNNAEFSDQKDNKQTSLDTYISSQKSDSKKEEFNGNVDESINQFFENDDDDLADFDLSNIP